jgi:hypothetical protein
MLERGRGQGRRLDYYRQTTDSIIIKKLEALKQNGYVVGDHYRMNPLRGAIAMGRAVAAHLKEAA